MEIRAKAIGVSPPKSTFPLFAPKLSVLAGASAGLESWAVDQLPCSRAR